MNRYTKIVSKQTGNKGASKTGTYRFNLKLTLSSYKMPVELIIWNSNVIDGNTIST